MWIGYMWMVFGVLSVLFTILSWVLAMRENDNVHFSALCAVSSAAIALLNQYHLVAEWVNASDWSALTDVVPYMHTPLAIYLAVIIIANASALVYRKRRSS